ncbi:MAG: hypothetical protein AAFN11_19290 [Chloroflexota bacterium]
MTSLRTLCLLSLIAIMTACTGQATPEPTAVAISKELVTVAVSPTPNLEEAAATRSATTPTPIPPTPTIIPSVTPYVGVFIGAAEQPESRIEITAPLFGSGDNNPIAQTTADPNRCLIAPIDTPYITAWRSNSLVSQQMGCPLQGGFGFFGEIQIFETGLMIHYPEINAIYAMRPSETITNGVYDYLENPPDTSTIGIQPSQGLIVPGGIFGDMWIAVAGLREDMGFARTEAQDAPIGIQRFEGGTFIQDVTSGQVYALLVDGTLLGPYLAAPDAQPGLIATPTLPQPIPNVTGAPESTESVAPESTPDPAAPPPQN